MKNQRLKFAFRNTFHSDFPRICGILIRDSIWAKQHQITQMSNGVTPPTCFPLVSPYEVCGPEEDYCSSAVVELSFVWSGPFWVLVSPVLSIRRTRGPPSMLLRPPLGRLLRSLCVFRITARSRA